jgi:hypothetical protein
MINNFGYWMSFKVFIFKRVAFESTLLVKWLFSVKEKKRWMLKKGKGGINTWIRVRAKQLSLFD